MSQGRNPWSDVGSAEALRVGGAHLVRAVRDASDDEAREKLAWAATLAGIAFGNAGVHVPHAMAYAVAGLVRSFTMPGYPADEPMVPHGISVVTSAPAAFRATASASPNRHLRAAELLGEDIRGARAERAEDARDASHTSHAGDAKYAKGAGDPEEAKAAEEAGALLARALERLMHAAEVPVGLTALGYGPDDIDALTAGTIVQTRLLDNAPLPLDRDAVAKIFHAAMTPSSTPR
jgi:alcohol dehydrogenase class IV